jgi:leucyl aminopeptidase
MELKSLMILSLGVLGFSSSLFAKVSFEFAALEPTDKNVHVENLETTQALPTAHIAYGYHLRHYSFDRYKTKKSEGESDVTLLTNNSHKA